MKYKGYQNKKEFWNKWKQDRFVNRRESIKGKIDITQKSVRDKLRELDPEMHQEELRSFLYS
jgi:hypothetical protein